MTLPRPAFLAWARADAMFSALRTKIVAPAARDGLPAIYNLREFVSDRGLMSHGQSDRHAYPRAAAFADGIRKSTSPGEFAVEQPTRVTLATDVATAQSPGIAAPHEVLVRADTVIQQEGGECAGREP